MEGNHGLARCFEVTERTLHAVFEALFQHHVELEGMLLKPNMVLPGSGCESQTAIVEVASATLRCLKRVVPAAVPGIVFLSGGQNASQATAHLNAMSPISGHPWVLSFSYGRALQSEAMMLWGGSEENIPAAQAALVERARLNSMAQQGRYHPSMERDSAA